MGMGVDDLMGYEMDGLATLMNQTLLAPDPCLIPFPFSVEVEGTDPAGGGRHYHRPDFPPDTILSYDVLWHPRNDDPRKKETDDHLAGLLYEQIISRTTAELQEMKDELSTVFVNGRNKGLLYQLCAEKEILWEPQGERRSIALARTTRGLQTMDDIDYGEVEVK